jgi:nitrite reductase/ring-hydroxylating ferredoxin subunit
VEVSVHISQPPERTVLLCGSAELADGGRAVPFNVVFGGQAIRAFAIRYRGEPHAYLNRCTHVPMEMDYQPGQFFDDTGQWLLCATHGAAYVPSTGQCAGGPCRGGLVKILLTERDGTVRWHTAHNLQPVAS